jgi:hypothetical protein
MTDTAPAASPAAKPTPEHIAATMLDLASERGSDKTICPSEVARAIGGPHPDGWGPLMPAVRRVAVDLMKAGEVVITRKGRPVDPDDFRGVYRIKVAEAGAGDGSAGPGNSEPERPESQ